MKHKLYLLYLLGLSFLLSVGLLLALIIEKGSLIVEKGGIK
jgi:hypothetical protein